MIDQNIDIQKLIRGIYEAEALPVGYNSESPVPDFETNILNEKKLLGVPVIDQEMIRRKQNKPRWPGDKAFAMCLTHDVDKVTAYSLRTGWRKCLRGLHRPTILKRFIEFAGGARDALFSLRNILQKDCLHCYEQWMELEKNAGSKSTFFFWPGVSAVGKRHFSDCLYELDDPVIFQGKKCRVSEMIREIDRQGWEIGLHPSWYSYHDVDEMRRQKDALEQVIGHEVASVRQHYLHYDIRVTPSVHAEAGFQYDSTLGFNNNIGFRFGTSYPWQLYDLNENRQLPLLEIPLIIQDIALFDSTKVLKLERQEAFQYARFITDEVVAVGGVLTLSWHPNTIIDPRYIGLYKQLLDYLKEKGAWLASVKDIGDWWKGHNLEQFQL